MNRLAAGVTLALTTSVISGVSIFVNGYAVKQVPDAAVFTLLKNGLAAMLLLLVVFATSRPRQSIGRIDRKTAGAVAVVGVFGGGVAFLMFFSGLALASAPSAAFIHKTLFVWVAVLAVPFLRERLGAIQIGALALLLGAQVLVAPPTGVQWGIGETLILGATLLWAVEVAVARRLLARLDAPMLGVARLGIGLVVIGGYVVATGRLALVADFAAGGWPWILVTGVLLAAYVATWFAALKRAPATLVTSVLVLGAPITAVLGAISTGALPAPPQVAGLGLMLACGALIVGAASLRRRSPGEYAA